MNAFIAAYRFILNKAAIIVALAITLCLYQSLPDDQPTPLAELLYCLILIFAEPLSACLIRLLVFPEVAYYAEKGLLKHDLKAGTQSPALKHYWFATAICHLIAIATLSHLISAR